MRILGLDPGLRHTGWGIIDVEGSRLRHVADGRVDTSQKDALSARLLSLQDGLAEVIEHYRPDAAAIEETFVNKNPTSTLKLGMARGVVMLAPARAGLTVAEYGANHIKKSVVGAGHADKVQVQAMVGRLLPGIAISSPDAADALAAAICHAHHSQTAARIDGRPLSVAAR
ncbi:MAG: crossover junction endodeoxyribonuclease RuvC [Pseudomonadota bacterium]